MDGRFCIPCQPHAQVGVTIGDLRTPDSTEVVSNVITGNLTCLGNSPPAQIGDSGGSANTVGGMKLGQCAAPGL